MPGAAAQEGVDCAGDFSASDVVVMMVSFL
jgi:hypothetical protein